MGKWEEVKLGKLCQIIGGGTPSKNNKEFYSGHIPWASVRDMSSETIEETEFKITEEAVKKSSTNVIKKGSIIIATRVGLGKVCFAGTDIAINQDLKGVIVNDLINNRYLFFYFKNIEQFLIESGTGATVKGVKLDLVKNLNIPLPPLAEQERIVAKLDVLFADIDEAIGLLEENIVHTQALMGSVLDEEFGKLEANGIELKPISEFAKTKSGGTPKRSERQFWNGDIPWLKSGELNDSFSITENTEFITELGLQKSSASLFENGTLLMAMYGATAGKLGILGMDACTNQAVCSIQNDKGLFDVIYVYFFLLSQRDRIIRESSGGAQPNISKGYIDKLEIPLPDIETQKTLSKKFFDYQNGINSIVDLETQKLTHLKSLKSSLLDQAFKGEL